MACQLNNYSIGVFAILSNEKKQNFTGQALTTNAFIEEEKNVIIQKSLLTSSITKKIPRRLDTFKRSKYFHNAASLRGFPIFWLT